MALSQTYHFKEYRFDSGTIARRLDNGAWEAGKIADLYHFIFNDPYRQAAIFDMIDQLEAEAREKNEPEGLHIRYLIDLDRSGGLWVERYADSWWAVDERNADPNKREFFIRIDTRKIGPLWIEFPDKKMDPWEQWLKDHPTDRFLLMLQENASVPFAERYPFVGEGRRKNGASFSSSGSDNSLSGLQGSGGSSVFGAAWPLSLGAQLGSGLSPP